MIKVGKFCIYLQASDNNYCHPTIISDKVGDYEEIQVTLYHSDIDNNELDVRKLVPKPTWIHSFQDNEGWYVSIDDVQTIINDLESRENAKAILLNKEGTKKILFWESF
jgi:hypothetical protein